MKLTNQEITALLTGVVYTEEKGGALCPYRFTEAQMKLYEQRPRYGKKQTTAAGIRLCFRTDSTELTLKLKLTSTANVRHFSVEVWVDGNPSGAIESREENPAELFEKTFPLGEGTKAVTVFFPHGYTVEIIDLLLDDGATFAPIKRAKKLLAFGDSITQGYYAFRPSARYTSALSDLLDAEEINKGVGGETFFPELAESEEDFEPDYITVAYGTNDWGKSAAPVDLPINCKRFYEAVSRRYPKAQIFAITPIWRADLDAEKPFGPFEKVAELIREVTAPLPNVTVIDGFKLVPADKGYFEDLRIHPNDEGFSLYSQNLYRELQKHLK